MIDQLLQGDPPRYYQPLRVLLAAHGFEATRATQNLGHNQSRMMMVAQVKG